VMALRSPSPSDQEESEEEDEEEEHEDSTDEPKGRRRLAKERRAAGIRKEEAPRVPARLASPDSSDGGHYDDEEGSGSASASGSDGEDEEGDATRATRFGRDKKAYYSGDADLGNMDSDSELDEDTKRELEVREAKRMQALAREGMDDADFGLPPALSGAIAGAADDEEEKDGAKSKGDKSKKDKRKHKEESGVPMPQIVIAGIEAGWQEKGSGFSSGSKEERERRRRELDGADEPAAVPVQAAAPQVESTESEDPQLVRERLLVQLEKASPETIALSGEFADIVEDWMIFSARLSEQPPSQQQDSAKTPKGKAKDGMTYIYAQTLNAYVTSLAFWLYLRSLPEYVAAPEKLRQHPVMARLLKFKKTLSQFEELGFGVAGEKQNVIGMNEADEEEEEDELSDEADETISDWSRGIGEADEDDDDDENEVGDLEDDELAGLLQDEYEAQNAQEKAGGGAEAALVKVISPSKQANGTSKKAEKLKTKGKKAELIPAPLADLNAYDAEQDDDDFASLLAASKKGSRGAAFEEISDADASAAFGDPTAISAQDMEEKAARKRSLKFYTSQISAKEARRGAAISKRDKLSGDMDIPYRDKQASREAVERARQAARQTGQEMDTSLDGKEFTAEDAKDRNAAMGFELGDAFGEGAQDEGAEDDGAEYYDLITTQRKAAKRQKKEEYDAVREEVR
jgi:U3 small nucleolar RNA-associated protein 3